MPEYMKSWIASSARNVLRYKERLGLRKLHRNANRVDIVLCYAEAALKNPWVYVAFPFLSIAFTIYFFGSTLATFMYLHGLHLLRISLALVVLSLSFVARVLRGIYFHWFQHPRR